jgi:hypothetical protein
MLGPPKLRRLDKPVVVSRENLVPRNHFYWHLEAKLDLSFTVNGRGSCMPSEADRLSIRSSSSSCNW